METFRIVAGGKSSREQANARGKLFEQVTATVLRHYGYNIDKHHPNVNFAGMELDIEGKAIITGVPLYAECKCYNSDVECEKLHSFLGKYTAKWFQDKKSQGLFIAIPGVNSSALGFYREYCENNKEIIVRLFQSQDVFDALIQCKTIVSSEIISSRVDSNIGLPGDRTLICSDLGFFWLQYIVPIGSGIASKIQIFDSVGNSINDRVTIEYLSDIVPEISQFEIIIPKSNPASSEQPIDINHSEENVVELRGSSSCFEYQFPASPEFFVGRESILNDIKEFAISLLTNNTSCRGILFEANSGWGKSSLVLATLS